jgi:2-keto-3-deoxy-L-rhamnonate aldolase RhmA
VVIDCEHGTIDFETAEHMIRAAQLSNTTAVVRIGLNHQKHLLRFLEAGAEGVLIPMINNAREAKEVVDAVKFPPIGRRGNYSGRASQHGIITMDKFAPSANRETFIALQIETPEGLENQDEIIATEHADAIFLGPGDLSLTAGYPGQPDHPEVIRTIEGLVKKVRAAGKQAGTVSGTPEAVKFWTDRGVNWHIPSATRFLLAEAQRYITGSRKSLGA